MWNVRQQALFPPSPYNAFNLSDALVTSLQDLWLRTNLVELAYLTPMYSNKIKIKNKVRSQGIAMAEGISYPVYSKGTNRGAS